MQKGKYTIRLKNGGEIPLWFSTWSLKKWAQSKNLSVDELVSHCINGVIRAEDMSLCILIAAENQSLEEGKEFNYTERDADKWVDDIGGLYGPEIKKIIAVMLAAIVDVDPTHVVKSIEVEKVQKKSASVGRSSTSMRRRPGSGRKR